MTADSVSLDRVMSTSCTHPASGHPAETCSGVCSPTAPTPAACPGAQAEAGGRPQADAAPVTNFYIEEILKPGFGRTASRDRRSGDSGLRRPSAFSPWPVHKTDDDRTQIRTLHGALGLVVRAGYTSMPSGSPSPTWISESKSRGLPASGAVQKAPPRSPSGASTRDDPDEESTTTDGERVHEPCTRTAEEYKTERPVLWPAWVYCTRYSDRPSSGPRSRKIRRHDRHVDEKRPRTAFTNDQLSALKREFDENRYLTEERRQRLASELRLNESQIKIWFQNKRAKMKKASGHRNGLALQLMAQGLYNHSTIPVQDDVDDDVSTS